VLIDLRRKGIAKRKRGVGRGKEERGEEKDVLVNNSSEELETWEDLSLWNRGLDDGRNLCNPNILGCYIVRSRYSRNVDICHQLTSLKVVKGAHHSSFQPGSEE